jgi:hypothetical protein
MMPKRSQKTGQFIKGTGLGKAKRPKKHKRKPLGSPSCRYGVNKNTGKCLKHPRTRR